MQSLTNVAPSLSTTYPKSQFDVLQVVKSAPADHVPAPHTVQPSVPVPAPSLVAIYPASQVEASQLVCAPPSEKVPMAHTVQSVADVAPTLSAIYPAAQVEALHVVAFVSSCYDPGLHYTHC